MLDDRGMTQILHDERPCWVGFRLRERSLYPAIEALEYSPCTRNFFYCTCTTNFEAAGACELQNATIPRVPAIQKKTTDYLPNRVAQQPSG